MSSVLCLNHVQKTCFLIKYNVGFIHAFFIPLWLGFLLSYAIMLAQGAKLV